MEPRRNPNRRFPSSSSSSSNSTDEEISLYLKIIKTVALKFERNGTISNLKTLLREKEGLSENHQELFFAGNQLEDDQRLVDYGIQQGSTLHLVLQNLSGLKIFIKIPSDQRTIEMEVRTCDTVQNIKSIIQAKEGIPSDRYTLIYDGKVLKDDGIVASLNISNKSTLHLVYNPKDVLPIYVRVGTGEILKLELKLLFTTHDVKAIAGSMIGVQMNDWDLIYAGKKLEDCKTLASYDIKEGTILEMFPAVIQIFVKTWSGKTITLDVKQQSTLGDVKDKIFQKLRIPGHHQSIVFAGKRLEDNRDLASYGVQMHSTLSMVFSPSQRIIPMQLNHIGDPIQNFTTIRILKSMIEKKMRSPVKEIYFNGLALRDDRSLADYRINSDAKIKVVMYQQ
ncbi:hypothetical protein ACB092_02G101800 [Castanea dentata]